MIIPHDGANEDRLMEVALEAGAEDFKSEADRFEILTDPAHFEDVHRQVEATGIKCAVAEVTELPTVTVPLKNTETVAAVNKLIDALEEHEDVKEVYSNAEFPD
jgi:transcriptional/translational regulatory protein YebC/TACO1